MRRYSSIKALIVTVARKTVIFLSTIQDDAYILFMINFKYNASSAQAMLESLSRNKQAGPALILISA